MARINWEEIRTKYVYGIEKDGKLEFPSQRDLAKEYNIPISSIGERCSREKWTELRRNFLSENRAKTEQKLRERVEEKDFNFDSELLDKAEKIIKKLDQIIQTADKPSAVLALSTTLRQLEDLKKEILGEQSTTGTITVDFYEDE